MTSIHLPTTCLLDRVALARTVRRLAHEIRENHQARNHLVLAGICQGGVPLALAIGEELRSMGMTAFEVAQMNVNGYRDDRPRSALPSHDTWVNLASEGVPPGEGSGRVTGATVILVDDVIQTGRTLRSGLDALAALGRPAAVQLAVLIDRGSRELPLRPAYVGKNVPAAAQDWIEVCFDDQDGGNVGAFLCSGASRQEVSS